jgi:hypothetical protein
MTEGSMRDLIEVFCDDEMEYIFSFWDERTADKKLLCASHDEAKVCRFVIASPLATDEQKQGVQLLLDELSAEGKVRAGLPHLQWIH